MSLIHVSKIRVKLFQCQKSGVEKKEKDQPGNGRAVIFWFVIHLKESGLGGFSQEKERMCR